MNERHLKVPPLKSTDKVHSPVTNTAADLSLKSLLTKSQQ
uniref:Uncharacterized protein n=1 Tax=Arundo donax TaxID=35708 RepID=A0A0A8XTF3_ARUDO